MVKSAAQVHYELTEAQSRLVKRHERALLRAASALARRNCLPAAAVMFVLADARGRIGSALCAEMASATIGPVVLPSRIETLEAWVNQLAKHAPVWDLQRNTAGVAVIVVDEHDVVAVIRIASSLPNDG